VDSEPALDDQTYIMIVKGYLHLSSPEHAHNIIIDRKDQILVSIIMKKTSSNKRMTFALTVSHVLKNWVRLGDFSRASTPVKGICC
jgi:hypothetical protein